MKAIPLKVDENVLEVTERNADYLHTSRNAYINKAIRTYNKITSRRILAEQLKKAAELCRESSMEVNRELDSFIDEGIN